MLSDGTKSPRMVRIVRGTKGTKNQRMVRKIHGTKRPRYEKSVYGTIRLYWQRHNYNSETEVGVVMHINQRRTKNSYFYFPYLISMVSPPVQRKLQTMQTSLRD